MSGLFSVFLRSLHPINCLCEFMKKVRNTINMKGKYEKEEVTFGHGE